MLLAALSILPYSAVDSARSEAEAELEKDRSMRVANLLGFSVARPRARDQSTGAVSATLLRAHPLSVRQNAAQLGMQYLLTMGWLPSMVHHWFSLPNPFCLSQDARRDARSALSRGALVADLGAKGVLNLVPEEIKQVCSSGMRLNAKMQMSACVAFWMPSHFKGSLLSRHTGRLQNKPLFLSCACVSRGTTLRNLA